MECCHKGQVITIATMIAHADIGAPWLQSSIFLILLSEEGCIHDVAFGEFLDKAVAHEDMVEASPLSVPFAPFCPRASLDMLVSW